MRTTSPRLIRCLISTRFLLPLGVLGVAAIFAVAIVLATGGVTSFVAFELDGDARTISENEDVKEFYLGLTGVGQRKSYRDVKHYRRRKRWLS